MSYKVSLSYPNLISYYCSPKIFRIILKYYCSVFEYIFGILFLVYIQILLKSILPKSVFTHVDNCCVYFKIL